MKSAASKRKDFNHVTGLPQSVSLEVGLKISYHFHSEDAEEETIRQIRARLREVFHALAAQKDCTIIQGYLMSDHVHMFIEIPPKYKVSEVVGFLKGKSAIAIAREFGGKTRNFNGEHFWARGYAVSTVGLEEEVIHTYIRDQEKDELSAEAGRF
jgi:putative transposase